MQCLLGLSWNVNLRVLALDCGPDNAHYFRNGNLNPWPTGGRENHNCDATRFQVLLIPQVCICRQEYTKSIRLGSIQKVTIL